MKGARVALSALSVFGVMASPATGWTQERLCQFTTTAPSGAPTIVGPNDVTSRLHVIDQPDSPVEIISADFTGTQLVVEEGTITRDYSFSASGCNRGPQPQRPGYGTNLRECDARCLRKSWASPAGLVDGQPASRRHDAHSIGNRERRRIR
jgi:hypothetical protein